MRCYGVEIAGPDHGIAVRDQVVPPYGDLQPCCVSGAPARCRARATRTATGHRPSRPRSAGRRAPRGGRKRRCHPRVNDAATIVRHAARNTPSRSPRDRRRHPSSSLAHSLTIRPGRSCQQAARRTIARSERVMQSTTAHPDIHERHPRDEVRQAAFLYLHVPSSTSRAVRVWRANMLRPAGRPRLALAPDWSHRSRRHLPRPALRWQNVIFARVVWAIHGLRMPTLMGYAFITTVEGA